MHGSGFIHGDINPNNILILREGAILIDSLDIPMNNVAHAGTPGWAAPEQVLVKPCTAATDVYALGLLLVLFLEGALYGEEKTYIVPTSANRRQQIRIISDPEVILLSELDMSQAAKLAWKEFLEKSIADKPEKRIDSAAHFSTGLRKLIKEFPLTKTYTLNCGPGNAELARNGNKLESVWVVNERNNSHPEDDFTFPDD